MEKSTTMDSSYSGTTACMAMVHNGYVYMANVGDSGACLGRLGSNGRIQAVELTTYARPNDPRVRHLSSGRDVPILTAGPIYECHHGPDRTLACQRDLPVRCHDRENWAKAAG